FSMVTDDAALTAITSGPDGILAGLRPGTGYVDMSTVSPQMSRELAERVHALGATMIDAPISGSVPAATNGTLTAMVGGPEDAVREPRPGRHQREGSMTTMTSNITTAATVPGGADETGQTAPRGRPRSQKAHKAVLDAAAELLLDQGLSAVSMDAVAKRAGVS